MEEKIVETKTCKHCKSSFGITDRDLAFYKKVSPKFNGEVFEVPSPTFCPDCRHIRRLSWRNEFIYYKTNCKCCGKNILSVYQPPKKSVVYCQSCWWGDGWEGLSFGKDFDAEKSFFEQYGELQKVVPKINMMNDNGTNSENSEYCYDFAYGKNNYYITTAWHCENSMYSQYGAYFNYTIDCNLIWNSELMYECMGVGKSYNCFFLIDSSECNNCFLGMNLIGCSDCFSCIGLKNKKYHIFNKKYSKQDYYEKIKLFTTGGYSSLNNLKKEFYNFSLTYPRVSTYQENCTDSVGDRLINCKRVEGFNIFNGEDCKYYRGGADTPKSSYDILIGGSHELAYESITPDLTHNVGFTIYCWSSTKVFYCDNCHSCRDCFGCIGLKNKQYCVFNKQYTKEEYNKLIPQIIKKMQQDGEWGEFFPSSLSPFGYNETVALEYVGLSKEEVIDQGFNWSNYELPTPEVEKIIPASKLPENIEDIPDDILNWAVKCEITKKPFRIIPQELEFYRKHNLPVPRRHPEQRYSDRMELRNPGKLFERNCDKCGVEIQTAYSSDRPEIVYCEECYNKEVY